MVPHITLDGGGAEERSAELDRSTANGTSFMLETVYIANLPVRYVVHGLGLDGCLVAIAEISIGKAEMAGIDALWLAKLIDDTVTNRTD